CRPASVVQAPRLHSQCRRGACNTEGTYAVPPSRRRPGPPPRPPVRRPAVGPGAAQGKGKAARETPPPRRPRPPPRRGGETAWTARQGSKRPPPGSEEGRACPGRGRVEDLHAEERQRCGHGEDHPGPLRRRPARVPRRRRPADE